MKEKQERSRDFVFTLNNYTEKDCLLLGTLPPGMKYLYYGYELGKLNKTPHLQGWFYFTSNKTFSACKKYFKKLLGHSRIHLDIKRGSDERNLQYCSKEGKTIELGVRPQQGTRTDLSTVRERLKQGERYKELIDTMDNLNIQTLRGIQILSPLYQKKRSTPPQVFWIYGSTGLGKTRMVYDRFGIENIYSKDLNTTFWENYDQEKVLMIDDFRGQIKYSELLKITDRYPYTVNVKGSSGQLNSPFIFITSCSPPDKVYKNIGEDIGQLFRRINKVINIDLLCSINKLRP